MDFNFCIGLETSYNLTCSLLCEKNWESKSNDGEVAKGKGVYIKHLLLTLKAD